jgi:hypothetical protein
MPRPQNSNLAENRRRQEEARPHATVVPREGHDRSHVFIEIQPLRVGKAYAAASKH